MRNVWIAVAPLVFAGSTQAGAAWKIAAPTSYPPSTCAMTWKTRPDDPSFGWRDIREVTTDGTVMMIRLSAGAWRHDFGDADALARTKAIIDWQVRECPALDPQTRDAPAQVRTVAASPPLTTSASAPAPAAPSRTADAAGILPRLVGRTWIYDTLTFATITMADDGRYKIKVAQDTHYVNVGVAGAPPTKSSFSGTLLGGSVFTAGPNGFSMSDPAGRWVTYFIVTADGGLRYVVLQRHDGAMRLSIAYDMVDGARWQGKRLSQKPLVGKSKEPELEALLGVATADVAQLIGPSGGAPVYLAEAAPQPREQARLQAQPVAKVAELAPRIVGSETAPAAPAHPPAAFVASADTMARLAAFDRLLAARGEAPAIGASPAATAPELAVARFGPLALLAGHDWLMTQTCGNTIASTVWQMRWIGTPGEQLEWLSAVGFSWMWKVGTEPNTLVVTRPNMADLTMQVRADSVSSGSNKVNLINGNIVSSNSRCTTRYRQVASGSYAKARMEVQNPKKSGGGLLGVLGGVILAPFKALEAIDGIMPATGYTPPPTPNTAWQPSALPGSMPPGMGGSYSRALPRMTPQQQAQADELDRFKTRQQMSGAGTGRSAAATPRATPPRVSSSPGHLGLTDAQIDAKIAADSRSFQEQVAIGRAGTPATGTGNLSVKSADDGWAQREAQRKAANATATAYDKRRADDEANRLTEERARLALYNREMKAADAARDARIKACKAGNCPPAKARQE